MMMMMIMMIIMMMLMILCRLGGERRQLAGCGRRHRHDSAR